MAEFNSSSDNQPSIDLSSVNPSLSDFFWNGEVRFLNPKAKIFFTRHNLPHWEQHGCTQFVTFRLADSLPQSVLRQFRQTQHSFISSHPKPWDSKTQKLFNNLLTQAEEQYLHNGYGSCIFQHQEYRQILEEALEFYNYEKYLILAYVIMPNHVHVLLLMDEGEDCKKMIAGIKRYSSRQLNKLLNRTGILFTESWDRAIRGEAHLSYCVSYIYNNPKNLSSDKYSIGGEIINNSTFAEE